MAPPHPAEEPAPEDASPRGADALLMRALGLTRSARPSRARLLVAAASVVLLIALLLWLLPRALDLDAAGLLAALDAVPLPVLVAAIGLGALAVLCEAVSARAALPGAPWGPAVRAHAASTSTALVIPGGSLLGIAITATVLRRHRVPMRTIVGGIAGFSVMDLLVGGVAIPLLALGSYAALGASHDLPGSLWAAILGGLGALLTLAVLGLVLHRPTTVRLLDAVTPTLRTVLDLVGGGRSDASRSGGAAGAADDSPDAPDAPDAPADLTATLLAARDRVAALLAERWPRVLLPMLLARICQFLVLWLTMRTLGDGTTGVLALLGVFLIGRALSLVPVTPGGGGITETVLALVLTALGTAATTAAAASLVLALATLVTPVVLGAALGAFEFGRPRPRARSGARTH